MRIGLTATEPHHLGIWRGLVFSLAHRPITIMTAITKPRLTATRSHARR